jgi:hypothetical protein
VERLLERRGLPGGAETSGAPDLWSEEAPVLAAAAVASVEGRVALGPRAGARVRRSGDPPEEVAPMTLGRCHAHAAGFDVHRVRDGAAGSAIGWSGTAGMRSGRRSARTRCTPVLTAI